MQFFARRRKGHALAVATEAAPAPRRRGLAVLSGAAICAVAFSGATQSPPAPPRPNIVIIQADDLGYGDLSAYGQARFQTPMLDRLAREGTRFSQYLRRQHGLCPVTDGTDDRHPHRPRLD